MRPTDLAEVGTGDSKGWPTIDVVVDVVEELGTEANVLFRLASPGGSQDVPLVGLVAGADVFTATVDARTRLRPGDRASLAVDGRRLHLFDQASGDAIPRLPGS